MSHTSTRILKTAGLLACTIVIAIGASMGTGVNSAMAQGPGVVCSVIIDEAAATDGGAETDDATGFACGENADARDPSGVAVQASAIGNESNAQEDFATAVGFGASVSDGAFRGVALGANANINESDNAIAIGGGTSASQAAQVFTGSDNAIAIGTSSNIFTNAAGSIALGESAIVNGGATESTAIGRNANIGGDANNAIAIGGGGDSADAAQVGADADRAIAMGFQADANGVASVAIGDDANAEADFAIAIGDDADALGVGSIAVGRGATAFASLATGDFSTADNDGSAYGESSTATGQNSSAMGINSSATHSNSAAWGANAKTTRSNQQVFGTANNTYTMGGITSEASRNAQSGPLSVVTTDGAGNLASDGGELFNAASQNQAGVAMAMSLENPDLTGNERLGIAANVGFFEDSTALGFTAMGVVSQNLMGMNERIAVSGGVTFSVDENSFSGNTESDNFGGRVGTQMTW